MNNLNNLLKILLENQIQFVVIGGLAAVFHGSSFVTRDLDICLALQPEEIKKLRKVLSEFHPYHRMTPQKLSFLEIPEGLNGIKNLYLGTDLGILDILGQVTGIGDFKTVWDHSIEMKIFGLSCRVMSLETLIQAKKTMGSPKDLAVVEELLKIKNRQP